MLWLAHGAVVRSITSIKTMFMENVSSGVLDENKEHYLRCKDKAKKSYDVLRHIQLYMSEYKKMKIYNLLCQPYSPTVVYKSFSSGPT